MTHNLWENVLPPGARVTALAEAASTNAVALERLKAGGAHGDVILAERQTAGRGRMGRAFFSPEGGLYMTVVLRGDFAPGRLTTLCAVAVLRAVERLTGQTLAIKWVNDVLLGGKKLCGILCEGAFAGGDMLGAAAGIGLNLWSAGFPPELSDIACALYPAPGDLPAPRERFAAEICREALALLPHMPAHMPQYRARCETLGRRVLWRQDGITRQGLAVDVDDEGALCVRSDAGETVRLQSGEAAVLRV